MKASIPARDTFWWNDHGDSHSRHNQKKTFNQGEDWWTDAQLDKKATALWALHHQRGRSAPWFMEVTECDYTVSNADAPCFTDAEKTRLEQVEQFKVKYQFSGQPADAILVPKALLFSFSRLCKEANTDCKLSDILFGTPSWYTLVESSRKKSLGFEYALRPMDRLPTREQMGTEYQFIRASDVFFEWMTTGVVVPTDDPFLNKEYMLKLACALDAPLFRRAVLEQI